MQDCEINGESVNPNNGNTTRGKTGLMRCKDRDTGVIQREQELRDGQNIGIVRFYKDGKLAKEHSVNEKGNMEGRAREFAANGQVVFDATYVNSNRVGISRGFHENGQPRRVTFYSDKSDDRRTAVDEELASTSTRFHEKAATSCGMDLVAQGLPVIGGLRHGLRRRHWRGGLRKHRHQRKGGKHRQHDSAPPWGKERYQ